MPPKHPKHPKQHHPPSPPHHDLHRRVPSSAISSFIDRARIDRLLQPFVPDDGDREFIVRCLLDEGPVHHRGANYVLLALLDELLTAGGRVPAPPADERVATIAMRLPPHLDLGEDGDFALDLPLAPLERLAKPGSPPLQAMIDCLTDGPPQHSLANAAMVRLLGVLLTRAPAPAP
jgi:hypothetical protein